MDGPMKDKIATTNQTTPESLIDDVIRSERAISKDAHLTVCPIITSDDRSEEVETLIRSHEALVRIFKDKFNSIQNIKNLSFDELLLKLTKQYNMDIVNSVADFIGLGVPKICQVPNIIIRFFLNAISFT